MDTGVDPGTAAFFVRGVLAINGHILGKEDGGGGDKDKKDEEERLKRKVCGTSGGPRLGEMVPRQRPAPHWSRGEETHKG